MQIANQQIDLEAQLIDVISGFKHDPLGFVMYAYPWGEPGTDLEKFSGPEDWQVELLKDIGTDLVRVRDQEDRVLQYSRGSGHGTGKSALLCWIIQWGLATFPDSRVNVTANTATQLSTKTWAELAKWHRLCICSHWFDWRATSYSVRDPEHEKNWRADAVPWSKNNPAAFAGLHNQGKRVILIKDEASEIDDVIWEVEEGAQTDKNTEILSFAFGNRTVNTGKFSQTFKDDRRYWNSKAIDSRSVRISNKELIGRWEKKYGIDSDFFRVRVRGEEPLSNPCQYIPQALITAARGKHLQAQQYNFAPVVIACDPAWQGGDETTVYLRQGLMAKKLWSIPKNDNDVAIANKLAQFEDEYKADAVFIDLGYGTGIYSVGKTLGRKWQLISFGGQSSKDGFLNKRAEMYGDIVDFLQQGGALPDDQQLCEELSWIETSPRLDGKIQLIDKEDMKSSPNNADGFALTFAIPVMKKSVSSMAAQSVKTAHDEYDPLA